GYIIRITDLGSLLPAQELSHARLDHRSPWGLVVFLDTPVRHDRLAEALGMRNVGRCPRLAARRVGSGRVVGLCGDSMRADLLRAAPPRSAVSKGVLAVRRFHPGLRHDAPDGGDYLLASGLPA